MFHPLLADPSLLKDQDLDAKILDLGKKYSIAARMGQGGACQQIVIALETYKAEQQKRQNYSMQEVMKKQNGNLDDLINID
jgi:hypothetical protein